MATQEKNQLGDGSDNYAGAAKQAANAAKSAKEAGKTAAKETAKKALKPLQEQRRQLLKQA